MAQTAVLNKILHVREQEKNSAQKEQVQAVDYFETRAKQLYTALKKKELAESELQQTMQRQATITMIREQSRYIDSLNNKVTRLQQHVQNARKQMEVKQMELTEAHVEMKKIEKMIEKRIEDQQDEAKRLERIEMDEISLRQFMMQVQNR